jgi:hypothetical protein
MLFGPFRSLVLDTTFLTKKKWHGIPFIKNGMEL